MPQATIRVTHEDYGSSGRYAARLPGVEGEAELTWRAGDPGIIVADHTYAPVSMRGTGVALALVPEIASLRPRSTVFLTAVVSQSPLAEGTLPSCIHSFQALALSGEHQI